MGDAAATVRPQGNTTPPNDDMKRVINEYRLMFRYANADGLTIDEKAQAAINAVGADPEKASFADLMTAHGALVKIVAPATPLSLEATEPAEGRLGTLRRPALVLWMIVIAIVAGIGFTWTEIDVEQAPPVTTSSTQSKTSTVGATNPSPSNATTSPSVSTATSPGTNSPSTVTSQTTEKQSETTGVSAPMVINWVCAAALGAVFYVLFTALQYVNNRTFDPRYNTVYLIRFVLGVLSGLIMAALIGQSNFARTNEQIMSLGPAVLALLGGFSTEAVYQILQRMVDVLLAAVKGDGSNAAQAKASQAGQKELLTLADDPAMSPEMKSKAIAAAKKIAS
jgi:hypothetical protein